MIAVVVCVFLACIISEEPQLSNHKGTNFRKIMAAISNNFIFSSYTDTDRVIIAE